MKWRRLLERLAFPLLLGVTLAACWQLVRPKPVPERHLWDFTGCGLGKPEVGPPLDLDGDPEHAVLVLAVHYQCGKDIVNLWQTPQGR